MDLIIALTYIVQYIHNTRQPYIDGLIESPGSDPCRINNISGLINGLTAVEKYIRKMAIDLENDNFTSPTKELKIEPLGNRYSESNMQLRKGI